MCVLYAFGLYLWLCLDDDHDDDDGDDTVCSLVFCINEGGQYTVVLLMMDEDVDVWRLPINIYKTKGLNGNLLMNVFRMTAWPDVV